MKPIPVKSSRSKRNSCFCQLVTIMAIGLCTVGFLAAVAGVIYVEVFANKSLTSYETSEKPIDLSVVLIDSQEGHTELIVHDFHSGKELPVKSSSETNAKNTKKTEEQTDVNARVLDAKIPATELNQYLNSENTKIKFQDSETVILEVKPSDSMKHEESSTNLYDFKSRISTNFTEVEDDSSADKIEFEKVFESKTDAKSQVPETYSDAQIHKLIDEASKENSDTKVQERTPEDGKLKDDSAETVSKEPEHATADTLEELGESDPQVNVHESSKIEEHGINSADTESKIGPIPESSEFHENEIQSIDRIEESRGDGKNQNTQLRQEMKILPTVQYADEDDEQVLIDHNVHSMIMEVDDPEEKELDDLVFSNRNGDFIPLKTTPKVSMSPASVKIENKHPVAEETESRVIQHKKSAKQPVLPKRTVDMRDMRVHLAEAMKHLQVLDTNNRILMSRKKTAKPQVDNTKKRKLSNASRKELEAELEKKKYLQKVRLMLYEQFQ